MQLRSNLYRAIGADKLSQRDCPNPLTNKLYSAAPTATPVSMLTALVFPFLSTITANITRYLPPASDDIILALLAWIWATTKGYI